MPFEPIAERTLMAREKPTGAAKSVHIAIGAPSWTVQGEEASCPVLVTGLHAGKPHHIRSIDPMSALQLALQYADKLIADAASDHEFTWPDGEPFENP